MENNLRVPPYWTKENKELITQMTYLNYVRGEEVK